MASTAVKATGIRLIPGNRAFAQATPTPVRRSPILRAAPTPLHGQAMTQTTSTATPLPSSTTTQPLCSHLPPLSVSAFASMLLLMQADPAHAQLLADLADNPTVAIAATLQTILGPLFTVFTLLYIIRIPMTWYPAGQIDGTKLPWSLAYYPTEPVLSLTRKLIPQVAGVDVSPIFWVCLLSFFNEILIGPQGILNLVQRSGGL